MGLEIGNVFRSWVNKTFRHQGAESVDGAIARDLPKPPTMSPDQLQLSKQALCQYLTPQAQTALDQIGDRLVSPDLKEGRAMIDHLMTLANADVRPELAQAGITKQKVLSELVQELNDPGLIHQAYNETCAPTALEFLMGQEHPAEHARLSVGMAKDGQVDMASGRVMKLNPTAIAPDGRGDRSDIDRFFTVSEMDQVGRGSYDNTHDHFTDGSTGLFPEEVTRLMNDLTNGADGTYRTVSGNGNGLINQIANATAHDHAVPVALTWPMPSSPNAGHQLIVTKVDQPNGLVYLHNPWGKDERAQVGQGPERQLVDNEGSVSMKLPVFQKYLRGASIPS